jgi:putative heme-binding domain-containing protein
LYALAGQGALRPDHVLAALADAEPRVREHALRLAERFCASDSRVQTQMAAMGTDVDPFVRYQLAFSLGAQPGALPAAALAALARRDGADPWMRTAIFSSVTQCAGVIFQQLAGDAAFRQSPAGRVFLPEMAAQAAANRPANVDVVTQALDGPLGEDPALARALVTNLITQLSPAAKARLAGAAGGRASTILAELLADARQVALDPKKSARVRVAAIRSLRFSEYKDEHAILEQLLAPGHSADVQTAVVETLSSFTDPHVPDLLLHAWPAMSPKLRATAAEALFARPAWISAFLDAVEKGTVGRADVDPARLGLLKTYPDTSVRGRASTIFAGVRARRQDVVAAYQKALTQKGDRERGKAVFARNCSTCHRLENVGQQVGAELSAVRDRGLDAVLLNILDPNREVMPQYLTYVLVTTSARVITGMISAESANGLTIRKPDGGEESVLRLDIEELRSTGLSFMPEGLEKQIDIAAMADLLAYLNSVK